MERRIRQYSGLASAILAYYIVHEGAHFLYALYKGVFKSIHFMGLGIQIDIFRERINDTELGWFCLFGPLATLFAGWLMVLYRKRICEIPSSIIRTCAWYINIILLLLDPIYLSLLYRWVGGGDMNGIKNLMSESIAAGFAVAIVLVNAYCIWKYLYPAYTESFAREAGKDKTHPDNHNLHQ